MTGGSFSMAYRSFRGGSGRLHTRLDTPPLINRRHPDSCLARQAIPHGVLQRAALAVVQNLMGRRLPDIEHRLALQMVGTNLVRDHDWPPSSIRPGSRRHAPGSAAPSDRSALPVSRPAVPAMLADPLLVWGGCRQTGRAAALGRADCPSASSGVPYS